MATAEDFGSELESLMRDTDQPQARSSAADLPAVNEPIDPVFQADAWGQYTQEQRLAMQQAQTRKAAAGGGYPQRPQQDTRPQAWQQPTYYGAAQAGQQGYLGPVGQPTAQPQAYAQHQFGQARWPPPEAAPAAMPGLVLPQEPQHSPTPLREVGRVVLSGLPGCDAAEDMLRKLVGPDPTTVDQLQTNRYYNDYDRGDKDPIPKWNGTNPAKLLKPWLRDLRLWRAETGVPSHKHGLKLFRSFEAGSWMKHAADRIPEDLLVQGESWRLILTEILKICKPYLDVETDVLIDETIFTTQKENKESMQVILRGNLINVATL